MMTHVFVLALERNSMYLYLNTFLCTWPHAGTDIYELLNTNCMCIKFLQVTYTHACTCCALVSYSNTDLQIGCSETILFVFEFSLNKSLLTLS